MATTFENYGPVGDFPVKGKLVLITGGGSGIGFEFTRACHQNGVRIFGKENFLFSERFMSRIGNG